MALLRNKNVLCAVVKLSNIKTSGSDLVMLRGGIETGFVDEEGVITL